VQAMLEWVAHQMMLIEAEGKVGAEKGKHSELALAALVQEAFINGVSTRRIERLAQALGVDFCRAKGSKDDAFPHQSFRTAIFSTGLTSCHLRLIWASYRDTP